MRRIAAALLFVLGCPSSRERPRGDGTDGGRLDSAVPDGAIVDGGRDSGTDDGGARLFGGIAAFVAGESQGADFAVAQLHDGTVTLEEQDRSGGEMIVDASDGVLILMDASSGRLSLHEVRIGLPQITAVDLPGLAGRPIGAAITKNRESLYVAVQSSVGLYAYDLTRSPTQARSIDLSGLHFDGNANVGGIVRRRDGRILVGIRRLYEDSSELERGDPAALLVIDPATDAIEARVDFPHTYLASFAETPTGDVLATVAGDFFEAAGGGGQRVSLDGAMYRLVPHPESGYTITATIATEQTLGGNVGDLVVIDDTSVFLLVDEFVGDLKLVHLDLSSSPPTSTILLTEAQSAAHHLCKSSNGRVVLSGSQRLAQFGSNRIAFIEGGNQALLSSDLTDLTFRPRTCAVFDMR